MKVTSKWVEGKASLITNDRNHSAVVDLPKDLNGTDISYTALEMTLMSLGGCISTICAVIAEKKKISFDALKVDIDAEKDKQTICSVNITANITTSGSEEDAKKVFEGSLKACPVGILFEKAGVKLNHTLNIIRK